MTFLSAAEMFDHGSRFRIASQTAFLGYCFRDDSFYRLRIMHVIGVLAGEHSKDIFNVVIRLTSPAQERKEVVFLIDNMNWKVTFQKVMNCLKRVCVMIDRVEQNKQPLADIAVAVMLGKEPDQWLSQEFDWHRFQNAGLLHAGHNQCPSLQGAVSVPFLMWISRCGLRSGGNWWATISARLSASGDALSRRDR